MRSNHCKKTIGASDVFCVIEEEKGHMETRDIAGDVFFYGALCVCVFLRDCFSLVIEEF